jgi:hypothetical protein
MGSRRELEGRQGRCRGLGRRSGIGLVSKTGQRGSIPRQPAKVSGPEHMPGRRKPTHRDTNGECHSMAGNRSRKPGWWLAAPGVRFLHSPPTEATCMSALHSGLLNRRAPVPREFDSLRFLSDEMAEVDRFASAKRATRVRPPLSSPTRARCSRLHAWLPARGTGFESRCALFSHVWPSGLGPCLPSRRREFDSRHVLKCPKVVAASGSSAVESPAFRRAATTENVPTKCRWRHGCFVSSRARSESARGLCRVGKWRPARVATRQVHTLEIACSIHAPATASQALLATRAACTRENTVRFRGGALFVGCSSGNEAWLLTRNPLVRSQPPQLCPCRLGRSRTSGSQPEDRGSNPRRDAHGPFF